LGHSFFAIDLLWEPKLTLDILNIIGLNKYHPHQGCSNPAERKRDKNRALAGLPKNASYGSDNTPSYHNPRLLHFQYQIYTTEQMSEEQ